MKNICSLVDLYYLPKIRIDKNNNNNNNNNDKNNDDSNNSNAFAKILRSNQGTS